MTVKKPENPDEKLPTGELPRTNLSKLTEVDFSKLVSLGEEAMERNARFFGNDLDEKEIYNRARRTYRMTRRSLPLFNALINTQCSMHAWNYAVAGFYMAKAKEAGLTTPKGMAYLKMYSKFAREAEKAALVLYELSAKYAKNSANLTEKNNWDNAMNWFVPKNVVPTEGKEVKNEPETKDEDRDDPTASSEGADEGAGEDDEDSDD